MRHDQELLFAKRGPVALRILDELVGFGNPDSLAASSQPIVENNACRLASFAAAGAVAQEKAFAELHCVRITVLRKSEVIEALVDAITACEHLAMRFACIDDRLKLRVRENAILNKTLRHKRPIGGQRRPDGCHGGRLHELGWMRLCACDCNRLHLVRLIKPVAEFCISGSFARFVTEFLRFLRCRGRGRKGRSGLPLEPGWRKS